MPSDPTPEVVIPAAGCRAETANGGDDAGPALIMLVTPTCRAGPHHWADDAEPSAGPPFMTTTPLYPHVTWPNEEYLDFTISVRQDKVTKFWHWEARGGDGTILRGRSVRPDYAFTTARTAINKRRSPP